MCLHDLTDKAAEQVLGFIKDAMSSKSFLLIDEIVLPDKGASINAMELDITMMIMFNATERTLPQWKALLGEVGLKITEVYNYDIFGEESVLEAVPIET